jgi:hypothetical protein
MQKMATKQPENRGFKMVLYSRVPLHTQCLASATTSTSRASDVVTTSGSATGEQETAQDERNWPSAQPLNPALTVNIEAAGFLNHVGWGHGHLHCDGIVQTAKHKVNKNGKGCAHTANSSYRASNRAASPVHSSMWTGAKPEICSAMGVASPKRDQGMDTTRAPVVCIPFKKFP